MTDRTTAALTIYDCPTDQVGPALDLITQHLDPEEHLPGQPLATHLSLGFTYADHEFRCRSAQEIASNLQQLAPGASWTIWEAPAYEWLGDLYHYTPTLGLFHASCDADGTPLFQPHQVQDLAALPNTQRAQALGETHERELALLARKNKNVTVSKKGKSR